MRRSSALLPITIYIIVSLPLRYQSIGLDAFSAANGAISIGAGTGSTATDESIGSTPPTASIVTGYAPGYGRGTRRDAGGSDAIGF